MSEELVVGVETGAEGESEVTEGALEAEAAPMDPESIEDAGELAEAGACEAVSDPTADCAIEEGEAAELAMTEDCAVELDAA